MVEKKNQRIGSKLVVFVSLISLLAVLPVASYASSPGSPGAVREAPRTVTNQPMTPGATKQTWDDFFTAVPRTAQDESMLQPVKVRLKQWIDPAHSVKGLEPGCALCGVTVDARAGYVRLDGKVASQQQRAAAEKLVRENSTVKGVLNAIVVGK